MKTHKMSIYMLCLLLFINFTSCSKVVISKYNSALSPAFACAINSNAVDRVYCWGNNTVGQLQGLTTNTNQYSRTPMLVGKLGTGVIDIDCGVSHSCAIVQNKSVLCWGINNVLIGMNGNGQSQAVNEISGVVGTPSAVAVGLTYSCILSSGAVFCWGPATGTITLSQSTTPQPLSAPFQQNIVSISAGYNHFCGVDSSGYVYCIGSNSTGQLGQGWNPILGTSIIATAVSAADSFTCAIASSANNNNGIYCWGDNTKYQMGTGTTSQQPQPVTKVPGSGNYQWTSISCGPSLSLAIDSSGSVHQWGYAQSNNYATSLQSPAFGTKGLIRDVYPIGVVASSVAVGVSYECIVSSGSNEILCQNDPLSEAGLYTGISNLLGQTGRATPFTANTVAAVTLAPVGNTMCYADSIAHSVLCIGIIYVTGGKTTVTTVPTQVNTTGITWTSSSIQLTSQTTQTCLTDSVGDVYCWGYINSTLITATPLNYLSGKNIVQMSSGDQHTCGVSSSGTVWCWGVNAVGEVAYSQYPGLISPSERSIPETITQVVCGTSHTCVLGVSGAVYCAGSGQQGQLGQAGLQHSYDWVTTTVPAGFSQITSRANCVCGVSVNHTVYCWGTTTTFQSSPQNIVNINQIATTLSIGDNHLCSLSSSGIACVGGNANSQSGLDNVQLTPLNQRTQFLPWKQYDNFFTDENSLFPIYKQGPGYVRLESNTVVGGSSISCAIEQSSSLLYCWGSNSYILPNIVSSAQSYTSPFQGNTTCPVAGFYLDGAPCIFDNSTNICRQSLVCLDPKAYCNYQGLYAEAIDACNCNAGFTGRTCDQCSPGFYNYPTCSACQCTQYATSTICDGDTGACSCLPNYNGTNCDSCAFGGDYPACSCNPAITCHGNGQCQSDGSCICNSQFKGTYCNISTATSAPVPSYTPVYLSCAVNNGNCGPYSNCTDISPGQVLCGACVLGYYLSAETDQCALLCGNHVCDDEPDIAEDCYTCPEDCTTCPQPACGNGQCGSDESCYNCPQDCGNCTSHEYSLERSVCPNKCSGKGTCINSYCNCTDGYGGPGCNSQNENVEVTILSLKKPIVVQGANNASTSYNVQVSSVYEIINGTSTNNNNNNNSTNKRSTSSTHDGSTNSVNLDDANYYMMEDTSLWTKWVANSSIGGGGNFLVDVWLFKQDTNFTYGTSELYMNKGAVKMSVTISRFPFASVNSQLGLVFTSAPSQTTPGCSAYTGATQDGNLKWIEINVGSVDKLYAQLNDYAIVDGKSRTVNYTWLGNGQVQAVIQHFWDKAIIDPSYQVLVDQDTQTQGTSLCPGAVDSSSDGSSDHVANATFGSSNPKRTIIIVVLVVVLGIVVIGAFVWFFAVYAKKRAIFVSQQKQNQQFYMDGEDLEIDRNVDHYHEDEL